MIFDVVSFGQGYGLVLLSFSIGIVISAALNSTKLLTRIL